MNYLEWKERFEDDYFSSPEHIEELLNDFKTDHNQLIKDKQELVEALKIITDARIVNKPAPQMDNSHIKEPCYVKVIYEQLDYLDNLVKRMEETK